MARFIYNRDGAEPLSWEFDPNKLMSPEAELIERLTGWTFKGWLEKLQDGSILALHALLYILLKRADPQLAFDDVTFSIAQIDMEYDDDDLRGAIETLQSKEDRTPAEQQTLDDLMLRELAAGEVPKEATAVTGKTSGSSGSPDSPPT
jgi:hypothetical protein